MSTRDDTPLPTDAAYKPLDCGNGRVAASVSPDGKVLALAGYHPTHGYAGFFAQEPFPDARRGEAPAVRAYRAEMGGREAAGFGLLPDEPWQDVTVSSTAGVAPVASLRSSSVRASVSTTAPARAEGIVQRWRLRTDGEQAERWTYRLAGTLWAGRSAMTELTEGGIVAQPSAEIVVRLDGDALTVTNPAVGVAVAIVGVPEGSWVRRGEGPLDVSVDAELPLRPGAETELILAWALGPEASAAAERARALRRAADFEPGADRARWQQRWPDLDRRVPAPLLPLLHRGLSYVLACCALPATRGTVVLTDHRILPLSWTRDAYYALAALRAAGDPDADTLLCAHLEWLFSCERPDGAWARAYLPNGKVKDPAYQLDQQCYPLLELAEALRHRPDDAWLWQLAAQVPKVLEAITARRAPSAALYATEETPADDVIGLPYHFSSHVLLWHTLRRLASALDDAKVGRTADEVADATRAQFTVRRDGERLFAYAIDLSGEARLYHDANDLPTAFAPAWGFCRSDDAVWRATMAFAFSRENDGWAPGPFGGLGSDHTPGAWPLGDVQELVYRRAVGDTVGEQRVIERLAATAAWDGALPEARDVQTGDIHSRHWFAWPGAALAYVCLGQ